MQQKRKKAAAIKYQSGEKAPKVTAKGFGLVADAIISKASEYGVTVKEDPDLVEALSKLDIYAEIPEELYKAVAALLAEIYTINKKYDKVQKD